MFVLLSVGVGGVSAAVAASAATRSLSESANHHTVKVKKGTTLVVTLHSTYWAFNALSGRALRAKGKAVTTPAPMGTCVPGGGCGTVTARFVAHADGSATISASRTSCGEALLCQPSQRTYTVKVTVTG
ncbi:MAG: hypothetical protein ACYDHH_14125 [Solirubrobacteraceae bacterium]